jgi:hypothetical protein
METVKLEGKTLSDLETVKMQRPPALEAAAEILADKKAPGEPKVIVDVEVHKRDVDAPEHKDKDAAGDGPENKSKS